VKYEQGYEPYVLLRKDDKVWSDPRFVGYGFDKVLNYTTVVLKG
jgi:hypothetical protein